MSEKFRKWVAIPFLTVLTVAFIISLVFFSIREKEPEPPPMTEQEAIAAANEAAAREMQP